MAVAVDAVSHISGADNAASFTDNSLTIGSEANRVLVYSLNFGWSTFSQPTGISITWDAVGANQPLSLITQALNNTGTGLAQLWGLVSPVSGNKILSVSWASAVDEVRGGGVSFTGANQTGGTTTFNFTNTNTGHSESPISVTVTTAVTDAVVGSSTGLRTGGTGYGGVGSGSQIFLATAPGLIDACANYELNGATPQTMSVISNSVDDWVYVGTNVSAAPPPPSGTVHVQASHVSATFNGHQGIGGGPVSVPGLRIGDRLIWLQSPQGGPTQVGGFEIIISVNNQIQQLDTSDLSAHVFNAIFIRGV